MTTFDIASVREFTAGLTADMDRCDNGEGMGCATLDTTLRYYADLCTRFAEEIRRWGREVFSGRVAFDPDLEKLWLCEGNRLLNRAYAVLQRSQMAEVLCFTLENQDALGNAYLRLYLLVKEWVTPRLAVGPSARQGLGNLDADAIERARQRVASLPPLPADWEPDDPSLRARFRRARAR